MDESEASGALLAILERCGSASSSPELLDGVLGELRIVAGAAAAVVVVPTTDGPVLSHRDGTEVPAFAVELDPEATRTLRPAPDSWREVGLTSVLVQPLPGHNGSLVLGWAGNEPPTPQVGKGTFGAAVTGVVDALRRIEAEEAYADLTQRVASAQQLAGMGDYDWHIASDTNRWSDQLYRIYGYEPQSFNASYERFLGNIHPDDRERIQEIHQQAYATGEPYAMIERIVRPDGQLRYLSSNGEVIMDADGVPVRMRGTCIDVTERVLAEHERERIADRFRGLVEASPEAILVVDVEGLIVQGNPRAAALLGDDPVGHAITEVLHRELAEGQGVGAVGLDGKDLVLDITRADLSATDVQARAAYFVADAAPRLEREALAQRLGASSQRRRQAFEINDSLVQGLTATSFALEQGEIDAARSYLDRTLIAARAMMDSLLEPSGHSLVAGDLVRAEAASLEMPPPAEAETVNDVTQIAPTPVSTRVLIVDDAEDIRMLLRLQLSRSGEFEVVGEASDGLEAIEQARALQPDLVLLDMAMPRMDGLQALPLIREAVPDVRVIVLSGFNADTLEAEAIAAGANRYLTKGGRARDLIEAISSVIDAA